MKEAGTHVAPELAAAYADAFAAYLADRGERELGAAYDIGRRAVAARLSVLDLAEAHHAALRQAISDGGPPADTLQAGADFLRESLSIFESVHRGYREVQEVARIEHEHVEQLRALADASVALNSSLTVEEILQLTADAARTLIRGARATVAIFAPDPRLRPLNATSPPLPAEGDAEPARLTARLTGRGRELGMLEVLDSHTREFSERDDSVLTQLAQLASVAISNAQLYERERTIAQTLQRSLRPGGLPDVPGLSAAVRFRPAGESVELGGDFYDLFEAGGGAWAALIGDVQGKGPDAAAVTALARHTLRAGAVYEHQPSGVLALLHKALREQRSDGRFCTVAHAHLRIGKGRLQVELACGGHPLPLVVHPDGRRGAGRPARHAARHRHRAAALRRHRRAARGRRAAALHRRRDRGAAAPSRGIRAHAADRAAGHVRGAAAGRGGRPRGGGGARRLRGPPARRHGDPGLRAHKAGLTDLCFPAEPQQRRTSMAEPTDATSDGQRESNAELLTELVAHLRNNRTQLRQEWARRIGEARLLTALTQEEIFSEATSVYDNYVEVLETGSVEALQDYARNLSERIIPRGVETDEVLGIVLLLRDVLARSLFQKYQTDFDYLNQVLDAYEPAANRIANTVAINFVQERERVIRQQQEAIRELSTPVLQVRERLLILPIIGVLDGQRARQLTEQLLRGIRANRARVIVIDITGVPTIDSTVANHLVQTVDASRLMGASVIITGLSPEIAQTLVTLGVDLSKVNAVGDLQGGIEEAERLLGYQVSLETPGLDAIAMQ